MEKDNTIRKKLMEEEESKDYEMRTSDSVSRPTHLTRPAADRPLSSKDSAGTPKAERLSNYRDRDSNAGADRLTNHNLKDLATRDFYKQDGWIDEMCEVLFKIKYRGTTIKAELYYGVLHFISCVYCLAVVPQQLTNAGYSAQKTIVAVALTSGVATIFSGLFANLPFVLAPPTAVSIFFSVFLQQKSEGPDEGSLAAILSGVTLLFFGWRPLGTLVNRLIPLSIQVGTAVGIGLLTSLAGSTEIDLVVSGNYVILEIGKISSEIVIAFVGVIVVCVYMRYHWKGSFCVAVIACSLLWWIVDNDFPKTVAAAPELRVFNRNNVNSGNSALLTVDLVFLYVLYLNGLMSSLSNLAALTRDDATIPRGRWVYIICGVFTVLAGLISSAPILVSPESSASIKEGAKTGLSAVVAGVLFILSLFFSPIFQHVPPAGTSPVLIMIGVVLFQNVSRIDWRNISEAAPAFVVLFYIPFTYSIIQGVILGYVVFLIVSVFTGDIIDNILWLASFYAPDMEQHMINRFSLHERRSVQSRKSMKSASVASGMISEHESGHHAVFDLGSDMVRKDSEVDQLPPVHNHERPSNFYATDMH